MTALEMENAALREALKNVTDKARDFLAAYWDTANHIKVAFRRFDAAKALKEAVAKAEGR